MAVGSSRNSSSKSDSSDRGGAAACFGWSAAGFACAAAAAAGAIGEAAVDGDGSVSGGKLLVVVMCDFDASLFSVAFVITTFFFALLRFDFFAAATSGESCAPATPPRMMVSGWVDAGFGSSARSGAAMRAAAANVSSRFITSLRLPVELTRRARQFRPKSCIVRQRT
jgi:hypothetical protein